MDQPYPQRRHQSQGGLDGFVSQRSLSRPHPLSTTGRPLERTRDFQRGYLPHDRCRHSQRHGGLHGRENQGKYTTAFIIPLSIMIATPPCPPRLKPLQPYRWPWTLSRPHPHRFHFGSLSRPRFPASCPCYTAGALTHIPPSPPHLKYCTDVFLSTTQLLRVSLEDTAGGVHEAQTSAGLATRRLDDEDYQWKTSALGRQ